MAALELSTCLRVLRAGVLQYTTQVCPQGTEGRAGPGGPEPPCQGEPELTAHGESRGPYRECKEVLAIKGP